MSLLIYRYTRLRAALWKSLIYLPILSVAIAPFHLWDLLGDHDQRVCESFYHALYACTIPMVRPFAFLHDISSRLGFKYRWSQHIVSMTRSTSFKRLFSFVPSHPDAAYICVFWEEDGARRSFSDVLRSSRHYHLGDQQKVNLPLINILFVKAYY